jgi:prepilin-type N-terminal cleavage/methylation domain-containing protein/prepilin-type processing-associated H-X9-DG protein
MKRNRGFTISELLVVVAVIALLASLLIPTLSRSRDSAWRVRCLTHLHQVQIATSMYSLENKDYLPAVASDTKWPSRLQPNLKEALVLVCPIDNLDSLITATNIAAPLDTLPRSYIMNGFYDYWQTKLSAADMSLLTKGILNRPLSMVESDIADPANTILFGEKSSTNNLFYLDVSKPNAGFLADLDENRHGFTDSQSVSSTGANYGMADGSVTFLRFGLDTSPLNMWGFTPASRTDASICRPR